NMPVPFMLLVRRMGRERSATMPIDEARAIVRLLYDDFATHCEPPFLDSSLQLVLDRLQTRSQHKSYVELLPLPTGASTLGRLKRLFRHYVYTRYYPDAPDTQRYLEGGVRARIEANPNYLDEALAQIAAELEARPAFVYANRDRGFTWEGRPLLDADAPPTSQTSWPSMLGS